MSHDDGRTGGPPVRCRALVLAGSRGGPDDPVARHAGERHKAFVRVGGVPMLVRVIGVLRESTHVGRITVCLDDRAAADPRIAELVAGGAVETIVAEATPSRSVVRALETLAPAPVPLLVTTADHPLLTAAMIDRLCAAAPPEADVAAAVVRDSVMRRAYPDSVRTYYRFAGAGYSGCNLFLLRTPAAKRAAEFWARLERHRKRPWRLVAAVGPVALVRFLLGRLSLDAALRHLSGRVGATLRAVELPFAEAAIDVDKPADLALADSILRGRR